MKFTFFRHFRSAYSRAGYLLLTGLLTASQAMADLPAVEQPTSGGGGGTYNTVMGYIKMGALAIGLLVCVGAFFAVAHAVITAFHDIRRGKGEWTQFRSIWLSASSSSFWLFTSQLKLQISCKEPIWPSLISSLTD